MKKRMFTNLIWYYQWIQYIIKSICNGEIKNRLPIQYDKKRTLSIVLNGPSVNWTVKYLDKRETDVMMVNDAPLTPLFKELEPKYVCLADPYYNKKIKRNLVLRDALIKSNNKVTIFMPHMLRKGIFDTKQLKVRYIFTPDIYLEDFDIPHRLLEKNLITPFLQNVAIMCIYVGIQLGYKKISIYGLDADFLKDLTVDKTNRTIKKDVHYYGIETFCLNEDRGLDMTEMIYTTYIMFRILKELKEYAVKENVQIVNMSDISWIDFFERFKGGEE